jgi:3-methyladenine DNA glycosylase AlkD
LAALREKNPKRIHKELLACIVEMVGKPVANDFLDKYLGNSHPKYPINNPKLRSITKEFTRSYKALPADIFKDLLTLLIESPSCTEKMAAGFLLDTCTKDQRKFNPVVFDRWLNHLQGWVEVDTLCTGKYSKMEITSQWHSWKKLLVKFAASKKIEKRRASLVLLCKPLSERNEEVLALAFENIRKLMHEREVLITKAISWVLRCMVKNYKKEVTIFVEENRSKLPAIAVRETLKKIKFGKKNTG